MTWLLWLGLWVLWTIVVAGLGYYSGYTVTKSEAEKSAAPTTYNVASSTELTADEIQRIADDVLDRIPPPERGKPGKDAPPANAKNIVMYNGDTLEMWAQGIYDRLVRVERKAGMSV